MLLAYFFAIFILSAKSFLNGFDIVTENSKMIQHSAEGRGYTFDGIRGSARRELRKRNVILLGPHDRYNFGDLLFTKVLVRLLQNRVGYTLDEILFGGITPVNMTQYGGEERILGMKTIQKLSREDTIKGPYDLVYTGGQSAGVSHNLAVESLPDAFKPFARSEQICGCGYLVPKYLLIPVSEKSNTRNIAVVNSIGKARWVNSDCKKAIDSADYVAFRDSDPLYPDSAVMIKELYGKEIDSVARVVLDELFLVGDSDSTLQGRMRKKYVAVQFKKAQFSTDQKIAISLDTVSRKAQAIIVFFAAGTAPGHDSLALYKKVSLLMKEPSIVYEAENVWNVVALVSHAEAVLSSSLHVRIMAFIYFKPRVTWCTETKRTETKHERFIENWDADDSARCVQHLPLTWKVLSRYYGLHPEISQDQTELAYTKTVKKYLESFDKWSSLLRERRKD